MHGIDEVVSAKAEVPAEECIRERMGEEAMSKANVLVSHDCKGPK